MKEPKATLCPEGAVGAAHYVTVYLQLVFRKSNMAEGHIIPRRQQTPRDEVPSHAFLFRVAEGYVTATIPEGKQVT